jgi:hypothetical protein
MIDKPIPTEKAISDFFNDLIVALESIKKDRSHSTIEAYLMAVCQALKAEWAGLLRCEEETWVVITKTEKWQAGFPTEKLGALLKNLVEKNKPQTLESQKDRELYLPGLDVINLAMIPFRWALKREDRIVLLIGNKQERIGPEDDLPYYLFPLLRFLAQLFEMLGSVVTLEDIQNRQKSWERALYGGSHTALFERASELMRDCGHNLGDEMLDIVRASEIDASTMLDIVPSGRNLFERDQGCEPTGTFSQLACLRKKAWNAYDKSTKPIQDVVNDTLKLLPELWKKKVYFDAIDQQPTFPGYTLVAAMLKSLRLFRQDKYVQEFLHTHLFVLHYSAIGIEGVADAQSIEKRCDRLFRMPLYRNGVSRDQSLRKALAEFIREFLEQWSRQGKNKDLIITSEWLIVWFGLKMLVSKEMWSELETRYTPNARVQFYRHFTTYFLYILHIIRYSGEPTLFRFSDVKRGYEGFVDSLIFLLSEYAHQVERLPRRIPLYKVMSEIWSCEAMLYTVREGYRDHLHHVVNVCLLGMVLMEAELLEKLDPNWTGMTDDLKRRRRRNWILAGLLHDVGYGLDLNRHMIPHLHFFKPCPFLKKFQENLAKDFERSEQILCALLDQWFSFGTLSDKLDHGIVSAIYLRFLAHSGEDLEEDAKPSKEWCDDICEAFEAIGKHNLEGTHIIPGESPLAFLLLLCDHLQEWDRPRPDSIQMRRSVSTLVHRPGDCSAAGSNIVRYFSTNLRWDKETVRLSDSDSLRLTLHCNDAGREHFEPAVIWCSNTYDFQRVDLSKWLYDFSIVFKMAHRLSDEMNKGPSFLEMDLFEDFVREDEKNLSLMAWIQEAHSIDEGWYCYDKNIKKGAKDPSNKERTLETFSWTFKQVEKVTLKSLLDYMPPKLYQRYMDWKAHRMREAKLRYVVSS